MLQGFLDLLGVYTRTGIGILVLALGVLTILFLWNSIIISYNSIFAKQIRIIPFKVILIIVLVLFGVHNLIFSSEIFNNLMYMLVVFATTFLGNLPFLIVLSLLTGVPTFKPKFGKVFTILIQVSVTIAWVLYLILYVLSILASIT